MRIFAFHLLNDYSGSPKVLMQLLKGWVQKDMEVNMVICTGRDGFLSDIAGVRYHYFWYRWAANPWVRLFNLTWSQILLFFHFVFLVRKEDIVYINTVLPFGAAFVGKIKGCKVIYHIHETSMKPALLKKALFGIAQWAADEVIYVSKYLAVQEPFPATKTHVLYNAIEPVFLQQATNYIRQNDTKLSNVLMVCSLKDYKGTHEFLRLASDHPAYQFRLVVNAAQSDIDAWLADKAISSNLHIFPTQTNLHPFYQWAHLVVNLSRPDGWIETFGLTIIEGMAYGLPAIVPPVGGITELVENDKNGFQVDCRDTVLLHKTLNQIMSDRAGYESMRQCALEKIQGFSEAALLEGNLRILNGAK
jgi:L-malate glycosyltransferase